MYEHRGYTDYLARNPDGSMVSVTEFRAVIIGLGIDVDSAARWFGCHRTTILRWMAGLGIPNPYNQARIVAFMLGIRRSQNGGYQQLLGQFGAAGDPPAGETYGEMVWMANERKPAWERY